MKQKLIKEVSSKFFESKIPDYNVVKTFKNISLNNEEISVLLKKSGLIQWRLDESKLIEAKYKFNNYTYSFCFLSNLAYFSEVLDHHSNVNNLYDNVHIKLNTHDCNGVSIKDIIWAFIANNVEADLRNNAPKNLTDISFFNNEMKEKNILKKFIELL